MSGIVPALSSSASRTLLGVGCLVRCVKSFHRKNRSIRWSCIKHLFNTGIRIPEHFGTFELFARTREIANTVHHSSTEFPCPKFCCVASAAFQSCVVMIACAPFALEVGYQDLAESQDLSRLLDQHSATSHAKPALVHDFSHNLRILEHFRPRRFFIHECWEWLFS